MKLIKISLAIFLTANAGAVLAQSSGAAVSNVFTSGTPAVAAEVNANFQELADRIQSNTDSATSLSADQSALTATVEANAASAASNPAATVYDFKDYSRAADITQKVFNMTTSGTCGDTETRDISRAAVSGGTEVTVLRTRSNDSGPCQVRDTVYLATDTNVTRVQRNHYDAGGATTQTRTYAEPFELRNSTMRIGQPIVSFSQVNITGGAAATDHMLYDRTLVAVEDVTVPAGTFTGCLKSLVNFTGGPALFTQKYIAWNCPDVGLVKIVENNSVLDARDTFTIRELSSVVRP